MGVFLRSPEGVADEPRQVVKRHRFSHGMVPDECRTSAGSPCSSVTSSGRPRGVVSAHRFLEYEPIRPRRRVLREIAVALLNYYFSASPRLSRSRWEKLPARGADCFEESNDATAKPSRREWTSKPIGLRILEDHLESGTFDYKAFDLVDPRCNWLDAEVHAGPAFHAVGSDGNALRFQMPTTLGATFPLVPTLDREGSRCSSFTAFVRSAMPRCRGVISSRRRSGFRISGRSSANRSRSST